MERKTRIIGIAGGTGSGKTRITRSILRRADVIIPEGGHNEVVLNMLMDSIQIHLEGARNG